MQEEHMGTRLTEHLITAELHPPPRQLMEEVMAGLLCMGTIWIWRIIDLECVRLCLKKKKSLIFCCAVQTVLMRGAGLADACRVRESLPACAPDGTGLPSLPALLQLAILPGFGKQQEIPFP